MSIDPGGSTGWVAWGPEYPQTEIIGQGTALNKEDVYVTLQTYQPEVVVCEEWKNYPGAVQPKWGKQETARIIGACEMYCSVTGRRLVMQGATILTVGYAWSGVNRKVPKNQSHMLDAYVHGFYYLVKQKLLTPNGGRV